MRPPDGLAHRTDWFFTPTDRGASWIRQDTGSNLDVSHLSFIDENIGMAVATNFFRGEILRTRDGGASWTRIPAAAAYMSDITFVDANRWIALGDFLLLRTDDAGES